MKQIWLEKDKGVALVDDDDFESLSERKWYMHSAGYARTCTGQFNGKPVIVLMHRKVMKATKGVYIDHRDHNKLNNQKDNLSAGTQRENMMNIVGAHRDAVSKYKGVWLHKKNKSWCVNYRDKYLASCRGENGEREAAYLYDLAALRDVGQFARLNFPIEGIERLQGGV